jgi:hypothetical protein
MFGMLSYPRRRQLMDNRMFFGGMAVGAALAMAFDPHSGGRRRALIRDKVVRGAHLTTRGADATLRDMGNRARGIAAATRSRVWREDVDDVRLVERVRARLGRACSHPHALDVEVTEGEVTLRGPILADEVRDVLDTAASVRGVHAVVNELEPHESAIGVPSLQGAGRRAGPTLDLLQSHWAPATRAMVGAAALAASGIAIAYARR